MPTENRDQTAITTGAGVELPVGRMKFTPCGLAVVVFLILAIRGQLAHRKDS